MLVQIKKHKYEGIQRNIMVAEVENFCIGGDCSTGCKQCTLPDNAEPSMVSILWIEKVQRDLLLKVQRDS